MNTQTIAYVFVNTNAFSLLVGLSGLEPPTSRLSGARSNQLSYKPIFIRAFGGDDGNRTHDPLLAGQVLYHLSYTPIVFSHIPCSFKIEQQVWLLSESAWSDSAILLRKEVIQPQVLLRLPCYDLTPIIEPTFDSCSLAVSSLASGVPDFHGLTGGVYKARERIHRGMLIRDY